MDTKKALWWVDLLFNIHKAEAVLHGTDEKANEIEEARLYIAHNLKAWDKVQEAAQSVAADPQKAFQDLKEKM